jgi:hypothetical protein
MTFTACQVYYLFQLYAEKVQKIASGKTLAADFAKSSNLVYEK